MKERIIEFLRSENKSSAQLAEDIGVQPSGISHILSGRNNPSLDFVVKMLEKYPYLSTEWLLFGKGSMYKDSQMQTLFDQASVDDSENPGKLANPAKPSVDDPGMQKSSSNAVVYADYAPKEESTKVVRIIWFLADNSFVEYFPKQ